MNKNDNNSRQFKESLLHFQSDYKSHGLNDDLIVRFRKIIYGYYQENARILPWRQTKNPYRIYISEMMLQQTQVDRVLPKYELFIARFPDFSTLAHSPFTEVLEAWQGLGYNRRALALHNAAQIIIEEYDGKLPGEVDSLMKLPGIGHATACEIAAFGFNKPVVFVETNIHTVFIHLFFPDSDKVPDREIVPLIERTLDAENPRHWYYALMDFGVMLKKIHPNPSRKSAHYQKQGAFEGSDRQIRGQILKLLLRESKLTDTEICSKLQQNKDRTRSILTALVKEGLLKKYGERYCIL